jgi:outer membrane protein OmpA-like peptidoglycan-associated protein
MASKKYSFLTGVLCLLASYGFAQDGTTTGTTPVVSDSSVIPSRRMPQHTEFMNGTYNFPARPRNQWEVGIKGGLATISGDVRSRFGAFGFGAHVRKAFGYIFSARLNYMYGTPKGQNWQKSSNYSNNKALAGAGYVGDRRLASGQLVVSTQPVFYNYRTMLQDLSLEGLFTLNNIRFHKSKTGFAFYGLVGVGGLMYNTDLNLFNENLQRYNYSSIPSGTWKNRKQTRDAIRDLQDDTYETHAEDYGTSRPTIGGNSYKTVGHFGLGLALKLNNRINIAIEDRFTFTNDDLLDGQRWAEQTPGSPVFTQNFDTYNYATLGLNFNLGSKSTEPLWWANPLDYAYSEIRNPRMMKLPKPTLPDSDGDGVTDQFDQEQTPAGCPVDSHGVSLDTDGDGVPDCKDKELITPTYCQPVDADGVGKCPCPEGCVGVDTTKTQCSTLLGALPSIPFSGNNATLTNDARSLLASVAARLRNNPGCRIVVVGYCQSSKAEQQRSWDRVNAVINYMVEKEGVSADRFIFQYAQEGGDCNTVDLRAANEGEEGPTTVPAPHPSLRGNR